MKGAHLFGKHVEGRIDSKWGGYTVKPKISKLFPPKMKLIIISKKFAYILCIKLNQRASHNIVLLLLEQPPLLIQINQLIRIAIIVTYILIFIYWWILNRTLFSFWLYNRTFPYLVGDVNDLVSRQVHERNLIFG